MPVAISCKVSAYDWVPWQVFRLLYQIQKGGKHLMENKVSYCPRPGSAEMRGQIGKFQRNRVIPNRGPHCLNPVLHEEVDLRDPQCR